MNPTKKKSKTVQCTKIIRNRRSIFPKTFIQRPIEQFIIEEILENANYAPTHRFTEPWRFKVLHGEKLAALGELLASLYKEKVSEENFSEFKFNKTAQKPTLCSHVIAICMQRDPKQSVPEWEEIAATSMAVQNMWLTASAYDIGAYWSSPSSIDSESCRQFLNLKEGQRCLGFFYMGYHEMPAMEAKRGPMAEKVEWL